MRLPCNWTQTVQLTNIVLTFLDREDVLLRDVDGKPMAVLVSPKRYEKMVEKSQ